MNSTKYPQFVTVSAPGHSSTASRPRIRRWLRDWLATDCYKSLPRLELGTKSSHVMAHDGGVCRSAPRIAWPLVEAIDLLDEPDLPIAEVWRRLCAHAARLDLQLPSYEQTRVLVHRSRRIRSMPGVGELALDVMLKARGPGEAGSVATERLLDRAAARLAVERERAWRPER